MGEKLGLKYLLANLVLLKDVRQSFLANPGKFLLDNPQFDITKDQLEQLKAFKIEQWDTMTLSELNDWLGKASHISRPVSVSVGIP